MREIKFKAWDKEFLKWSDTPLDYKIADINGYTDYEWCQYAGLRDKNDIEIYDGDIISFSERTINGSALIHICRVFQHERGTWRVEGYPNFKTDHKTRRELYVVRNFCEVIGNIYENPELMEG